MRYSTLGRLRTPLAAIALVAWMATGAGAQQKTQPVRPVQPGAVFPAGVFNNLNAEAGGPASIDLAQVLGRKPVLLFYWVANNGRAEEIFRQVQSLVGSLGSEQVALYGVAIPRPHIDADVIRERIKALGITVPVLEDEGYKIGQLLRIISVPNLTLIDKDGKMQLTNAASLSQVLGYEVNVEKAVRRIAETGNIMTYGYLAPYYPVKELEGRPCPDFKAPLLTTQVEQRYHSLLDDEKLNVLIFWSVDCSHCRKSLPAINEWLKQNPDGVNVISAASIDNEAVQTKTLEFCKVNDFKFPTLMDKDAKIGKLYRVTSTPTIVIIGPDGIVDSAIVSGYTSFGETIEKKKRQLLGSSG